MSLVNTALTPSAISTLIPGLGYVVLVDVAWDNSYPTGGETWNLSAYGTTVIGAWPIAETLNDGGYVSRYVRGAAGAAASGLLQSYCQDCDAVADSALIETTAAVDLSAINGQRWAILFSA
jgi:hypothetical protein